MEEEYQDGLEEGVRAEIEFLGGPTNGEDNLQIRGMLPPPPESEQGLQGKQHRR